MIEPGLTGADAAHRDDLAFGPAFNDADELRESSIPHRYLRGGFEGDATDEVRFVCNPTRMQVHVEQRA
jgi:hypothetical protein